MSDWQADWHRVRTLKEARKLIIMFLEGEHTETPWYGAKIDVETTPIVNLLKEINTYGFLTITSQPKFREAFLDKGKEKLHVQREFIEGLIPNHRVRKFRKALHNMGVFVYSEKLDAIYIDEKTVDEKAVIKNNNVFIPLTWYASQTNAMNEIASSEIEYSTKFSIPDPRGLDALSIFTIKIKGRNWKGNMPFYLYLQRNATYIFAISFDEHKSLFNIIRNILKRK